MAKRLNPNNVKIHRSYTVSQITHLYPVHKNTVRSWIKEGLATTDKERPLLILGRDLKRYLQEKREGNQKKCKSSEIYCVKCRAPKIPAENMVDYKPINKSQVLLSGLCPTCENIINKFSRLEEIKGIWAVQ